MGTQLPPPKGHSSPLFSAHVYCGQTARLTKMPLGTKVGLGPGDIVLDGDPAPPKGHSSPQFLAYVCCGQMAGWIEMPVGTEVGLGPGHIVLVGTQLLPKEHSSPPPSFRPLPIVSKRSPISATAEHLLYYAIPEVRFKWHQMTLLT